jgi:ubiquinone/menaquinone biosynthesis C-methylase UbiE
MGSDDLVPLYWPADYLQGDAIRQALQAEAYAARTNTIDMSPLYARFEPLLSPGSLLLDLGCGGGRDARHFASVGHRVIAMDPCPELLAEARGCASPDVSHPVRCMVGTAPGLPLADSCCSAVWACASLLHLLRSEMPLAPAECSRILLPGGIFLVTVKRGSG